LEESDEGGALPAGEDEDEVDGEGDGDDEHVPTAKSGFPDGAVAAKTQVHVFSKGLEVEGDEEVEDE